MTNAATVSRFQAVDLLAGWLNTPRGHAPSPVDWPDMAWTVILQEAVNHGVHLLLHEAWCLDGPAPAGLPAYVGRWLAREATNNKERNRRLLDELAAVLNAAAGARIPVMPFKGAALIGRAGLYPCAAVRPLADLDLLIQPPDLPGMQAVLARLGYTEEPRATWKHRSFIQPGNRAVVSISASDPDNPRRIEVHTALAEDFLGLRLDLTGPAWASSATGSLAHAPAQLLAPAVLFLHIAAHASQDVWERKARLVQLVDLRRLAAMLTPADWAVVGGAGPAAQPALVSEPRLVLPAFLQLERTFRGTLPVTVTARLASQVAPELVAWLVDTPLAAVSLSNDAPRRLTDALRWTRTPRERLVALRRLAFPDRYELLAKDAPHLVNTPFYPLAYLLHLRFLALWLLRRVRPHGQRQFMSVRQQQLDALGAAILAEAGREFHAQCDPEQKT